MAGAAELLAHERALALPGVAAALVAVLDRQGKQGDATRALDDAVTACRARVRRDGAAHQRTLQQLLLASARRHAQQGDHRGAAQLVEEVLGGKAGGVPQQERLHAL
ncbi:MAG: hypothetical protein ACK4ZJ_20075, partial [Allorhizobium sp.]